MVDAKIKSQINKQKISQLEKILKLDDQNCDLNIEIGKIFFDEKEFEKALQYFFKALKLNPSKEINHLISDCYFNLKEFKEAINFFKKICKNKLNDNYYNKIGISFKNIGEYQSALKYFNAGLKINPENYLIYFNKANLLREISNNQEAKKNYENCIKINKKYFPAYINLSLLFSKELKFSKALENLESAEKISKNNPVIYENLAKIHLTKKNYEKSEFFFKKAIKIKSSFLEMIRPVLLGYSYHGKKESYKKLSKFYIDKKASSRSIFLFNKIKKNRQLRVGFISPDIRNHPIGYFLKDLFPKLSCKIDLNVYFTGKYEDDISNFSKKYCSWVGVSNKNDYQLSELIFNNRVDILFDLSGFAPDNRLGVFKLKPAPIQISWAGWLASTFLKEIDYIVGDNFSTPAKDKKNFLEKIYNLEDIWCVYSKSEISNMRISNNSQNNSIIYGCFQRPEKLNKKTLETWAKILSNVKDSYLFFNNSYYSQNDEKIINSFFSNKKINTSRIRFNKFVNRFEYLNSFNLVDINLDTFPYNGGTTTFESSYMGVPTLTMENNSHMFRCGESININLKMRDWIASNHKDYVERAIKHSNKKLLRLLKNDLKLRAQKSVLFNTELFCSNFIKMLYEIV